MEGDDTEWVTISAAARRLGVSRAAIYGRIKRGSAIARIGNAGREVQWPMAPSPVAEEGATLHDAATERDRLQELQELLMAAIERAARAEGELAGERRVTQAMGAELVELRARLERAERPWWRRLRRHG